MAGSMYKSCGYRQRSIVETKFLLWNAHEKRIVVAVLYAFTLFFIEPI